MNQAGGMFIINGKGFSMWTAGKGAAKPKQENQPKAQKQKDEKPQQKEEINIMDSAGLKTHREYYEDTYKFESTGKVIALGDNQIVLDKTIFHPQGGGQPMDYGTITSKDGKTSFKISDLKSPGEAIIHIGSFTSGSKFSKGEQVKCKIDGDFRKQNARIHSAGHLLDVAMNRAGRTDLKPGKGYHFVEGPYVEYIGVVPDKEREPLIAELNKHCAALIKEANDKKAKVFRKICTYDEANEELKGAGGTPTYCDKGKEIRVLKLIPEDLGCPCGGTHVHEIGEIGEIVVQKMKKKKQNTQVTYKVVPPS